MSALNPIDHDFLQQELLAVTGKKAPAPKKKPAPRRRRAQSDDDDDDDDDDVDESSRSESSEAPAPRGKRSTGGGAPQKKRQAAAVSDSDSEEDEDDDGYDSDLYGDAEDRARLMAMPDIDREIIINERYQARQDRRDRATLTRGDSARKSSGSGSGKDRRSGRAVPKNSGSSSTQNALKELRADRAAQRRRVTTADSDSESDEDEARGSRRQARDRQLDEQQKSLGDKDGSSRSSSAPKPKVDYMEVTDIQSMEPFIVTRNEIVSWMDKSIFADKIVGFVVRYCIGSGPTGSQVYRMCSVVDVKQKDLYKLGDRDCNVYLELSDGKNVKKFPISNVSNSKPTQEEFERFKRWRTEAGHTWFNISDVKRKSQDRKAIEAWRQSDVDKLAVIRQKSQSGHKESLAKRKYVLIAQRLEFKDNPEKVAEIDEQLVQLEQEQLDRMTTAEQVVANIARRNTHANRQQDSSKRSAALVADDLTNPFTRRHCAPTVMWDTGAAPAVAAPAAPVAAAPAVVEPTNDDMEVDQDNSAFEENGALAAALYNTKYAVAIHADQVALRPTRISFADWQRRTVV